MSEWQPIERFEKDRQGLVLVATASGLVTVASGYDGEWVGAVDDGFFDVEVDPTHFMELPDPPERLPSYKEVHGILKGAWDAPGEQS